MDHETIPESARREAGAEFVAALARDLAHEWCEIVRNIQSDVESDDQHRPLPMRTV